MKKPVLISIIVLIVAGLVVAGLLISKKRRSGEEVRPTPTPEAFIETSLEERPFVALVPSSDGHWLNLVVSRIVEADSLEYELTYETEDGLTQGALGGPYQLKGETSYEKKILLGTESSGHYRYHEGVKTGSLMVRLDGGPGPRKFFVEFEIVKNTNQITMTDAIIINGDFIKDQPYLIMQSIGLPASLEKNKEVIGGPYAVYTSGSKSIKNGEVNFYLGLDDQQREVYMWDGREWQVLANSKTAEVGVFVLTGPRSGELKVQ